MYKINDDIYVRATDDLNFIVSKKNGYNKENEIVYNNIAYFNSIHFINNYCMSVYNKTLFNDLETAFTNAVDYLSENNIYIYFLNSFDNEDYGKKEILSCEVETSDLSKCYKIFYNETLKGYYPKLHQSWKSLLTVYILRMFTKNIRLERIVKEIKSIVQN